jgi:hypothetical protein
LYASINDQPISLRAVEANKWQAPAGPKYLPRLITLAYRVPPMTRGSHRIEAPRIAIEDQTLPWEQCLWSVSSDARLGMTSTDDGEQISWEAYQRGARRVTLATAVAASSLALQLPESESNQWLEPWSRRLDNRSAGVTASMEQESTWAKIRQQLPTTNSTGNDFDEMPFPAAEGAEAKNAVYFQTASIALDLSTESDPAPGRWFAALAIAAVAGVAYRRPRTLDNIAAALRSQPALFALALGLFWWLAFTPRWIGPIIIVLAVAVYTKRRRLALEARQRRQARHNLETTPSRRSSPSA